MQVKKGDKVKIIAGKDKGKTGTISSALPKINKVVVDGINVLKRHKKSNRQGQKGSIIEIASPIDASNVKKI